MPFTETNGTSSFKYRPDIDGLRAIAVLPVLLYHAKLGCSGGFVGVDVFFVISGYVISSLILKELTAGTFSMVNFWERRIRRILPALSVVVAAVLAMGWLLFLPAEFQSLGNSVMAQSVMGANFYFWKGGTNYFAHSFDTKPLLHTWSLAVEEQFYLLFPLLMAFLFRTRPKALRHWLLGIAALSLVISVLGSYSTNNHRSAFYLLPSRIWELLTGALLALNCGRFSTNTLKREFSGFLGMALIAWSIFAYDDDTRFPGLAALLPCLGAALIIASSEAKPSIIGRLISFKPFVFIGLVSYPLYLWHWPLLIYATYVSGHELSAETYNQVLLVAGLLLASFLLAVLSWKFVEMPFRQRRWLGERRQIFRFAGITTGVFFAFGFAVYSFNGFPTRFTSKALEFSKVQRHPKFHDNIGLGRVKASQFMELGSAKSSQPISLLVWGDSHAMAAAPAFDDLCREYSQRGVLSAYAAAPPVLNYIKKGTASREMTPEVAERVVAFITRQHIKNVLLCARWNNYPPTAEFKDALLMTARTIMAAGSHVCVLKNVPEPGINLPRIAALNAQRGIGFDALGITKEQHQKSEAAMESVFEELTKMGATVLDAASLFLTPQGNYRIIKDGELLYFDSNHLTREGATLLVPLFRPLFQAH